MSIVPRACNASLVAAIAVMFAAPASALAGGADVAAESPSAPRQRELVRLLRQDCGSCHGMRLTGGLGPPLTPQSLSDKPASSLTATIVSGRAGTAMPPWRPFITEAEAAWLVARLQQGDVDAR